MHTGGFLVGKFSNWQMPNNKKFQEVQLLYHGVELC